jgi:hypothetical protein
MLQYAMSLTTYATQASCHAVGDNPQHDLTGATSHNHGKPTGSNHCNAPIGSSFVEIEQNLEPQRLKLVVWQHHLHAVPLNTSRSLVFGIFDY